MTDKRATGHVSARIQQLIDRDGPQCVWCSHRPWHEDLTVDHVLPRSRRGRTDSDNLLLACKRCNHARRSKAAMAYVRELQAHGGTPNLELLRQAFGRLQNSSRRAQREYGRSQLRQLERVCTARR